MNQLIGLCLGLTGSLWTLKKASCPCKKEQNKLPSPPILDRKTLGTLGAITYSVLLFGSLRQNAWVEPGIKVAFLIQAILLGYALKQGKICPSCLTAAAGSLLAYSSV